MSDKKIHILLVEDSPSDARLLRQIFLHSGQEEWQIEHIERLSEAIDMCKSESHTISGDSALMSVYQCKFNVILLDLSLPDSTGLDTVKEFRKAVPDIPIVVLTGFDDEELALQALAEGAQDYIFKDNMTIQLLSRAIRYAIQRGKIFQQLRESEKRTREALAKEQELNQLKSNFVAMVSHEFRTPMSIIRTSADLLENYDPQLTEERKNKYFQRIQSSIDQMVQLLDEVLFLSRSDAEKVKYEPVTIDLQNFCQEIAEILQINTTGTPRIIFNCQGECLPAQMDEDLLSCILTNLLSNAIKYSSPESKIYFDVVCQDGIATFQIKDKGIGIPEKDLARLFETFYRAKNVGKIQGTGLGLVIVKRCVDLHGGEIKIESEEGVGTTVAVRLPMQPFDNYGNVSV
ncbi:MAG: ATP-binding protein [Scytonema sp. PMC 1069.18]|nr:ATP-binding protein [Scytonema sp. PMC 1069.18]MEC4886731.1 ATP-binding protein [Scytonema sp. PMC 1070.18]